jgi:hypothetical protein
MLCWIHRFLKMLSPEQLALFNSFLNDFLACIPWLKWLPYNNLYLEEPFMQSLSWLNRISCRVRLFHSSLFLFILTSSSCCWPYSLTSFDCTCNSLFTCNELIEFDEKSTHSSFELKVYPHSLRIGLPIMPLL